RKAVAALATLELVDQLGDENRARCSNRVSQRNAASIGICLVWIEAELGGHCAGLRGKSLVRLHYVQVSNCETGALQYEACGGHWTRPHVRRLHARMGIRNQTRNGFEFVFVYCRGTGEQHRGGAVIDTRGVAGGN